MRGINDVTPGILGSPNCTVDIGKGFRGSKKKSVNIVLIEICIYVYKTCIPEVSTELLFLRGGAVIILLSVNTVNIFNQF